MGPAPTALSLVEWLHRSGEVCDATAVWEDWEAWFRLLIETHTLAPIVAVVPSVHREQSWLVVAAAVLDSASLWLSSVDAKDHASATLCYSTGVNALKSIAAQLGSCGGVHWLQHLSRPVSCCWIALVSIPPRPAVC
jgi:hypothetical protein